MKTNIFLSRFTGMLLLCLCANSWMFGQSAAYNYRSVQNYLDTLPTAFVRNICYEDGFGRTLRDVQVNATPDGKGDLIVPYSFGCFGREERNYLPYVRLNNAGAFDLSAFQTANWSHYGTSDQGYAFSLTQYDNSPLQLVTKEIGSGRSWQVAGKGMTHIYGVNTAGEVRLWRLDASGNLQAGGYYPAGSLEKNRTEDEDGKVTEVYTDCSGHQVASAWLNGVERYETYQVYDDKGQLRYVLPPQLLAAIDAGENVTDAVARYGYAYLYDNLGRLVEKRLPGVGAVYLVYDERDRLAASQDGNQRLTGSWSYMLYDDLNRPVESGLMTEGKNRLQLQAALDASVNYIRNHARTAVQYTVYDSYVTTADVTAHPFAVFSGYASGYQSWNAGRITSTKTRILGTDSWQTTTCYYDDRGRVIQTVSDNRLGGLSRSDMKYDFTGNLLRQRESHGKSTGGADVFESVNTYDTRGRLLTQSFCLNGGPAATLTYQYDPLGRMSGKKYGILSENLSSNIRGWLTDKTSSVFRMSLRYELPQGGTTACYNGNISEWEWQQGSSAALMYGFSYDALNRFTGADEKQKTGSSWGALASHYTEQGVSYDRNGNLLSLQRTAGGNLVDHLSYSYTGNQLTGLTENVATVLAGDVYTRGSGSTGSYSYDSNGNMTNDSRNALNLSYNSLNLLSEVRSGTTLKAAYTWLADGTKLGVRDGSGTNGFEYIGSLIYAKSSSGLKLCEAHFGEGVIRLNSNGTQELNYFLTDHLGSVRAIVDGSGVVKERNDYYPFGSRHAGSASLGRWKYNGKEEQTTGALGYLDYGARMYNAALGRWMAVDPLSESYYALSSYNYCGNNPISRIDPDGAWDTHYVDKDYNVLLQTNDKSDDVVMVPDSKVDLFAEFAGLYSSWNHSSVFDSPGWNNHWKEEFGLAENQLSEEMLSNLNQYSRTWSRNAAVANYLKPTLGNAYKAAIKEALSQWTRPELVIEGLSAWVVGMGSVGGRPVKGSAKNLAQIKLRDGMKVSSNRALELGEQFLGKGYKELVPGSGRYVSIDGTRVFRMGKSDITGAHAGGNHVNFEILVPNPIKPGKMMIDKNYHVYLED